MGIRALEACDRADVVVVAVSERPRDEVAGDARVLGLDDYLFDEGFVLAGEEHELPVSATRAEAIAEHARARALALEDCVGVGDSLDLAPAVGTFWLAGAAPGEDPLLALELERHPNVRLAEGHGEAAFYEAVVTTLMERRA